MTNERYGLVLLVVGLAALLAAWVPAYTARRPLSLPIVLVAVGAIVGGLGLGLPSVDPRDHLEVTARLTEVCVIVALMGAGLKIDRPFRWRTWTTTWRMVLVAMPVTIVLVMVLGLSIGGLALASALLLGASLAPTDPVLASDVQVGEPTLGHEFVKGGAEGEDDVRFTLTSEGGLNDALAFPFVYAAIRIAEGSGSGWAQLGAWLAYDVAWRIAAGVVVGVAVGRLMGVVAFRPPGRLTALAEQPQGFIALAATFIAYGATELVHGYGFLAVFVAAVALRSAERGHEFHAALHDFVEQVENMLVVGLLLLLGVAISAGLLSVVWWQPLAIAVGVVFVVRPLSGQLALLGTTLTRKERWAISFFGIRGVGSVYYLTFALLAAPFSDDAFLWSTIGATLALSIVVHGISATPAMREVDREAGRRRRFRRPVRRSRPAGR